MQTSAEPICGPYEEELQRRMTALDAILPSLLLRLIRWLESKTWAVHSEDRFALLVAPRPFRHGGLYSLIRFELPQDNFMESWLGKPGYERQVIPFIACGGDGSYIGFWPSAAGAGERFVFLGSEGECFTVADNCRDLIALLAMGYDDITGRWNLELTPQAAWGEPGEETPWTTPEGFAELKEWSRSEAGVRVRAQGSELLPFAPEDDPFVAFVDAVVSS